MTSRPPNEDPSPSDQYDPLKQPHMYPAGRTWTVTLEVTLHDKSFDEAAEEARFVADELLRVARPNPVHIRSLRNSDPIEKVILDSPPRGRKVAKADRADETLRHQQREGSDT